MEWTPDDIQTLRTMRQANHSNRDIAHQLGRTIVSVGTKARELKLPQRNFVPTPPITPPTNNHRHRAPIPRAGKVTLPPLPSLA